MAKFAQNIKVIGFDLDQTLYPKSPEIDEAIQGYIYKKISEHRQISLEEAEGLFKERYKEGKGMGGSSTLRDLGVPNASEIVQEALERAEISQFLIPDTRTLHLLERIRTAYKHMDLITGSNITNAFKKLEHLRIPPEIFTHVLTSEDGSKSQGESYMKWLHIYPEFTPDQFLYIGDRPKSDYEIPKSLGIQTILVNVETPDPLLKCPQLTSIFDIETLLLSN